MDNSKIISLKQELISNEGKISKLSSEVTDQKNKNIIGYLISLFGLIVLILTKGSILSLILIIGGIVLIMSIGKNVKKKEIEMEPFKSRIEQIKIELVKLENE